MFVNVTLKSGSPVFLDINQVCLIHQLPKKHHHFDKAVPGWTQRSFFRDVYHEKYNLVNSPSELQNPQSLR